MKPRAQDTIRNLALSALFAALIFLATAFIKISILNGYIHAGDSMIFLAASILPFGWASAAAAVGAGLADIAAGFPVWAPFTLVIKFAMAALIRNHGSKIVTKRNIIMTFAASAINIAGYYFTEVILYGNWVAPVYGAFWNLFQFAAGVLIYVVIGAALDRISLKKHFFGRA